MSSAPKNVAPPDDEFDPIFIHSRREAIFIFFVWAACLLWAVPYCYTYGYPAAGEEFNPENLVTIIGMPSWVFYGVVLPWLVAIVFSTWFCFFYMEDDDLGTANEGVDIQEEIAEMNAESKEAGQ
jgi:hypothetical protein